MTAHPSTPEGGFSVTASGPEFFIKDTPPAPEHRSLKMRRFTDLFYKAEHEAHVRVGNHPRIVRYYGWDNRGLLFEKHNRGDLLRHLLITKDAPPPLSTRLQWASDIAEGIAFLHSKGVVWVDVSLSNVLLSHDAQRAVLCDLGGSCILPVAEYKTLPEAYVEPMVSLHPMVGLPPYEHKYDWDGPGSDPLVDVTPHHDRFGYGILLFSMLALHFPHSPFLVVRDHNEAMRIAELQYAKQFDTLGGAAEYAAFERIIQKCFHAEYMSSNDLDAEVKAACAAMVWSERCPYDIRTDDLLPMQSPDAPLLQSTIQDPPFEYPPSSGRNLVPFAMDYESEEFLPNYDDF